jgi:3-hydroxy-9,10-secoandrosta-1,3,5(10)-triene-9,17-dione monooxygenase
LVAVTIGVAQGAIDRFVESMKERSSRFGSKVAEFQSLQLRLAESSAEVDAAKKVMMSNLRETMEFMEHNDEMPIKMMARNKRDMAYCPILAQRAVDRIFYAAGAGGLLLSEDIQRSFRDVHAGNKQIALNWDINGTTYGKVALGLDPAPVRW